MVYLNRIYTKSGDRGETCLGDATRVPKTNLRIAAFGGIDELNALLGIVQTAPLPEGTAERLRQIQNDLFDLGADLCLPEQNDSAERPPLRATGEQVRKLEVWIDEVNESLTPLESFVLPGGSQAAAYLHHARTVCRRVEIGVCELAAAESINANVAIYLNRLSDLLFVLARESNDNGNADLLWVPGGGERE